MQEAKEDLLAAAAVDPTDPRSHYVLAEIYQKLNQPADRQRELDLFNQLTSARKTKGSGESENEPAPPS